MSEYIGDNAIAMRPRGVSLGLPDPQSLIPESSPYDPWWQKATDIASMPAREAVHGVATALGAGAESFTRSMQGNVLTDPQARQDITMATLGLGAKGLVTESPGPGAFAAWHGSGHRFEEDPYFPHGYFDPTKMGTGEGTQWEGWGHYVAGGPQGYNRVGGYKTHGTSEPELLFHGQPWDFNNAAMEDHEHRAMEVINNNYGDLAHARYELQAERDLHQGFVDSADPHMDLAEAQYKADLNHNALDFLDYHKNHIEYKPAGEGHTYQVWVHPEENEMLDWDRPFSMQPRSVREKILNNFPEVRTSGAGGNERDGSAMYRDISNARGGDEAASKALDKAGIPGTKYRDYDFARDAKPDVLYYNEKPWVPANETEQDLKGILDYSLRHNPDVNRRTATDKSGPGTMPLSQLLTQARSDMGSGQVLSPDLWKAHMDWMDKNMHKLTLGDHPDNNRNYVIYHPRHLSIIDRDGEHYGMSPVDYNPFAVP